MKSSDWMFWDALLENIKDIPKIRGTLFGSPHSKDPTIKGTILGSLFFGNSRVELKRPEV